MALSHMSGFTKLKNKKKKTLKKKKKKKKEEKLVLDRPKNRCCHGKMVSKCFFFFLINQVNCNVITIVFTMRDYWRIFPNNSFFFVKN